MTELQIIRKLKSYSDNEKRYAIYINNQRLISLFFHSEKNAIDFMYDFFPKDRGITRKKIENMVRNGLNGLTIKQVL